MDSLKIFKDMKRKLFILGLMIFTAMSLSAQLPKFMELSPEVRAKTHTEWMITTLKLNPNLSEKIYSINLQFAKEVEPVKSDEISKFKKIKIIRNADGERLKQFKTFMTPDQVETYIQKRKELFDEERKREKESAKN